LNELPNADVAGRADGTLPPIRFGTDGWRARIAHEFTFANLERAAQAYATFLTREHTATGATRTNPHDAPDLHATPHANPLVIVGYDRRFLSKNSRAAQAKFYAAMISTSFFSPKMCRRNSSHGRCAN
jgi:phosphomannomutase